MSLPHRIVTAFLLVTGLSFASTNAAFYGSQLAEEESATRDEVNICEEVAHELGLAVVSGLIEEEAAKAIVDRCYESL